MATDKIRPCTAAELLAFQYMKDATQHPKYASHVSQSFFDERDNVRSPSPRKKKARSATTAIAKRIAPAAEDVSDPEMPNLGDSSDSDEEGAPLPSASSSRGASAKELRTKDSPVK